MSERENKIQGERGAFEKRMVLEAEKIGVPVQEFIEDYAREENAAREANAEADPSLYETGEVSKVVERQIKETVLARIAAHRDKLTGLHNRHFFESEFRRREVDKEHKGEFSMIIIDIDHFKKINDLHGHLAGDFILKEVASVLKQNMRAGDSLARYGGEELVVLAPNTNGDAPAFAERLRKAISDAIFTYHNPQNDQAEEIRVTISAGVAPFSDDGFNHMVEVADRALYKAKGKRDDGEDTIEITESRNQVWYYDKKKGEYKKFKPKTK
jgi:diguanylate cyclase (GGDEF)-like protein